MHIDLCLELNDDEVTPEMVARRVREFEAALGGTKAVKVMELEVTPMDPAAKFHSEYLDIGDLPAGDAVIPPAEST